jgi:THO complex subunit 2
MNGKFYCSAFLTYLYLKKMGVISLNSKNSKEETKAEEHVDPFLNDPTIGIFRYMLAVGKWDDAVAFLANASVEEFKDAVCNEDVEKLEKTMKTAVLAASSLSDSVAEAVCGWVAGVIEDVYKEARNGALVSKDTSVCDISNVLLDPLTSLVGSGKIRLNQSLYKKLCGLYRTKLTSMKQSENKELDESSIDLETFAVLSTFLVPSISLFPPNPDLSRELWSVLQLLPHSIRYKLYSAWRSPALEKGVLRCMLPKDIKAGNFPKPLDCIESEIKTALDAKSIMKRISKENIEDKVVPGKPTEPGKGRELSGISHNNPLVVFSYILNQIESYDNMILLMVDTFQFVTALGLDVIGYCLLLSLGGGDDGKNRTKSETIYVIYCMSFWFISLCILLDDIRIVAIGLNTEQWLTSLETFTGAFYKKFPDVELRGLLSYITQRLKEGHATELGVLRSLIKTAGGYGFVDYDSTSALSELQLDGRCGSRLLKLETSSFGVIDHVNPRASWMLRSVLQGQDLGIIILILLSQIRQNVLYSKSESKAHVKVMGRLYDNCESVLCLLLEYVSDSSQDPPEGPSTKEKFANSLPPLNDLCDKYGLDTSTAWMLIRPLFRKSMFYKDDKKLAGKSSADEPPAFLKPFSPTPEMTSSYQKLLPEPAWKHLSTNLFETFFSLAIYDIQCPSERYSIEISRLNKEVERLTQLQQGRGVSALAAAAAAAGGNERQIREATRFTEEHKKELNRLKFNVEKLSNDFSRQKKRCELVHAKIEAQKDEMFQSNAEGAGAIDEGAALAFLTFCIYPRFLSSPEDALFCAHFVKLMHKMKIPGLSVVELIDGIVNAITGSLYCITEDEAGNAAIFLNEIWKSVNSWRYDNDSFATELKGTVRRPAATFMFPHHPHIDPYLFPLHLAWLSAVQSFFTRARNRRSRGN